MRNNLAKKRICILATNDYKSVLLECCNKDCLCYGQKTKSKNGKKIMHAIRIKVYGNPKQDGIETNTN